MDLIKEQKSAIRIIKGSALFAVGSGERAAGIAKQRCRKQLRVVSVVGTIQFNKWLISRDHAALDGILINQRRQMALTDSTFSGEQDRQTVAGIIYRRAAKRDCLRQASLCADQLPKCIVFFRHYARRLHIFHTICLHKEAHRTGIFFTQMAVIAQSVEIMTDDAAINLHEVCTVWAVKPAGFSA